MLQVREIVYMRRRLNLLRTHLSENRDALKWLIGQGYGVQNSAMGHDFVQQHTHHALRAGATRLMTHGRVVSLRFEKGFTIMCRLTNRRFS